MKTLLVPVRPSEVVDKHPAHRYRPLARLVPAGPVQVAIDGVVTDAGGEAVGHQVVKDETCQRAGEVHAGGYEVAWRRTALEGRLYVRTYDGAIACYDLRKT
ncbi:MAG TPA: hypothetical protein VNK04_02060 [Gemmataceae bacterium]|nr:hypothetical protein [Gemmataceae bacterium]